jgi:hypothetical protein
MLFFGYYASHTNPQPDRNMTKTAFRVIENEGAYNAAIKRNIIANAKKTFAVTYADSDTILATLELGRVYEDDGRITYKDGFFGSLAMGYDNFGKLSPKQVEVVRGTIEKRKTRKAEWDSQAAALNASRVHLGEVGTKVTLTVIVKHIVVLESMYGVNFIHICEDEAGNVVIYKGKAGNFPTKGLVATITATVKEHGVRDGVKQTVIQRPKVAQI